MTVPSMTAPRKFVFDSIVAVRVAPSGRLTNAHAPPAESARAITYPAVQQPARRAQLGPPVEPEHDVFGRHRVGLHTQ